MIDMSCYCSNVVVYIGLFLAGLGMYAYAKVSFTFALIIMLSLFVAYTVSG